MKNGESAGMNVIPTKLLKVDIENRMSQRISTNLFREIWI